MRISKHITYAEAIHSNTAKRRRIDNTPNPTQVDTMKLTAEKIFEPFYRHPNFKRNNLTGNGLGLAIAKSGIEWNKGKIEAITTNQDFTIKITLPIG